ncbi:uncharacterized protein LOC126377848 isoform X3 [Pectinophora gossypiella]|uniref:uncharacterized protein LOC126377848 isoform X3 n=1 Tax=Pectinophora gossypiella TaxID=13191 RepID=UPI00214DFC8A|nr:uncharacterized protein LOC126377848 isoform X3 [Pectinophora gossypiella]
MYYKCCVCESSRQDAILHHFPCTEKRLNKWLKCLEKQVNLKDTPKSKLSKLFVCQKHFESKFITAKSHLLGKAYPSLFTEEEIASGIPLNENYTENENPQVEHNYTRERHFDHSYCNSMLKVLNNSSKETGGAYDDKIGDKFVEDILQDRFQQNPASQETGVLDGEDNVEEDIFEEIVDDDFHQIPGEAQPATLSAGEFSWQRASAVVPGDADDVAGAEYDMEAEMFEAPAPRASAREQALHEGYRCNGCGGSIVGFRYNPCAGCRFRYVCVQCADVDLCSACEAAGQHMRHYALRVPGPRAYDEVAAVLHRVRQALLADSILLGDGLQMEAEVKEEPEEADPIATPADPIAMPSDPIAMPSDPIAMPANPIAMPTNLIAMPANLIAMPANLIAMPGNPISMQAVLMSMPKDPISVQAYPIAMPAAANDGDECEIEAEVKKEPEEPDPIAMPADPIAMSADPIAMSADPIAMSADPITMSAAANDGDEYESVGAASAAESTHALEADTAASDDDDSYAPSEDDSDSDTEAGRSAPGHTVDYSTPTRSQSHHASPSSARAVKRPAPDPICYFDLRKNAAMIAGDRSKSDMKPAALRRQPATQLHSLPRHEDDTLADKRPLSAAQVLLDSKRARVILERLDDTEVHTPRVKR